VVSSARPALLTVRARATLSEFRRRRAAECLDLELEARRIAQAHDRRQVEGKGVWLAETCENAVFSSLSAANTERLAALRSAKGFSATITSARFDCARPVEQAVDRVTVK
jgi:hypothetical protein